ncbi:hypothetical protein ACIA5D_36515 [Actinoplanes sp. NPDC051513]|uniref:hypothetical protein n=1 Tax=Actinoplanes sp. NPDC051513 TaxID=3363908 RepID=UPI0037BC78B6
MTVDDRLWNLDRFPQRLALWRDREQPPAEVLAVVEEWIPTRRFDPRRGAQLERAEDDFWWARVPGSHYDGQIVICSYWIVAADRVVRCDLFSTLSWPA